jgi:hypothetical protein
MEHTNRDFNERCVYVCMSHVSQKIVTNMEMR